ncbi:MAG: hypothetical protein KJ578_12625 [Bacteroidetes bacterium]|nr:hypothetical protein [Bacteroidota bacterium]
MTFTEKTAIAAVIGGTADPDSYRDGGGKPACRSGNAGRFANGAVTGAFVMAFNHLGNHRQEKKLEEKWKEFPRKDYMSLSPSERAEHILNAIKFSNQNEMDGIVPLYSIFENLKNFNTLQNAGIKINQALVSIDGNDYTVQIIAPLFNSVKAGKFLGSIVQFKGGNYAVPFNNGWYRNYNTGYQIAVFGEEKFESLMNWLDYK